MSTGPITARNRWFTAPPSPHGISAVYVWDPNAVTGSANAVTGNFVPLETGNLLGIGGTVVPAGGTFNPSINVISATGQIIIPANAKSWSVSVVSGVAFVDGAGPLFAGTSLQGGNYDIRSTMSRTMAVGGTGANGSLIMPNILVTYDT